MKYPKTRANQRSRPLRPTVSHLLVSHLLVSHLPVSSPDARKVFIMANTTLFKSQTLNTNTLNLAGGKAYAFSNKHALAQLAATGCLNRTFYATAEAQLDQVLTLLSGVSPEFIAKTAIYARQAGYMKDMPALLCAALTTRDWDAFKSAFAKSIDNGKMLRTFIQILRSGAVGRKSLGTVPKRAVLNWLEKRSDEKLFHDSVGNAPSLADVIKLVHPKPSRPEREALYGYLLGRTVDVSRLPEAVRAYEAFKADRSMPVPDVPFQLLTSLELGRKEWTEIARRAPWQMTRMNLNTFLRHGVFEDPAMRTLVANRLRDADTIRRARVFPYQLLTAFQNADEHLPSEVIQGLEDAMELALENVPAFPGAVEASESASPRRVQSLLEKFFYDSSFVIARAVHPVYVLVDVSGSMSSPVTGVRAGATTKTRCIDVAALFAAAILRKNPQAKVMPFDYNVVKLELHPSASVMTNARLLASVGGGGTSCSAPLAMLNKQEAKGELVIYVSDNESWMDQRLSRASATMLEWETYRQRNPKAKLVCIDLTPNATTQAPDRPDIFNVGGFSDAVFTLIDQFARGALHPDHWVGVIERIALT